MTRLPRSLAAPESQLESMTFDPYKMQGALFSMNDDDDASETMFDFGFQDCDTYLATKSSQDYQTAIQQAVQDADFVKVRWFVSSSSPAAGDSVHAARRGDLPDHLYQRNSSVRWGSPIRVSPLPNPRSLPHLSFSSRETYPITGLPVRRTTSGRQAPVNAKFTTFFESLPLYVKALREQDPKSTKAAVIECKLLLATRKYVQGHQAAEKHLAVDPDVRRPCLSRRPPLTLFSLQCAYMYYILAMGNPDPFAGLKWAEKVRASLPPRCPRPNILTGHHFRSTRLHAVQPPPSLDRRTPRSRSQRPQRQHRRHLRPLPDARRRRRLPPFRRYGRGEVRAHLGARFESVEDDVLQEFVCRVARARSGGRKGFEEGIWERCSS